MAASPYALLSSRSSHNISLKPPLAESPLSKSASKSLRKAQPPIASLTLQNAIGTTTDTPNGLSSHPASDSYAYCAGSAAVLARVQADGQVSQRFFKARPTVNSINPVTSIYEPSTPTGTPKSKRKSFMPRRVTGYSSTPTGSPFREWTEDGTPQTWTARERIKAASCVALSADGNLLAVGETGYGPRVLIFSTADDGISDVPLSIISEHSYGVRSVAFSPDMRYLATLGDMNDGFLFMWSLNARTGQVVLHSANKCTANVLDMTWCGNALITVGTRHVKVWRVAEPPKLSPSKKIRLKSEATEPNSPAPRPLEGRNCLLGSLVEETFTCVAAISVSEAVICTESGHICLLEDTGGKQELRSVREISLAVTSIAAVSKTSQLILGLADGGLHREDIERLRKAPLLDESRQDERPLVYSRDDQPSPSHLAGPKRATIAMVTMTDKLVSIDDGHNITLSNWRSQSREVQSFPSHKASVMGVEFLPIGSIHGSFFSWSTDGQINFWSDQCLLQLSQTLTVEQLVDGEDCRNELRVAHYENSLDMIIFGDRFGVLNARRCCDWSSVMEVRAHSADVCDVASYGSGADLLVATCGRDRIVQVFRGNGEALDLIQTMDEHIGGVNHVLFSDDGKKLLSSSADRTVIIRDRARREVEGASMIAFACAKVVTLKATPISIALIPNEGDCVVVSTMDRYVVKLSIASGSVVSSFKATDPENEDTVVLNSISVGQYGEQGAPRLLAGFSSTDKSIRVYDLDKETLLTREFGHSEGVSALALREIIDPESREVKRSIISSGLDGTILIWGISLKAPQTSFPLKQLDQDRVSPHGVLHVEPAKGSPASRTPLRKILTKSEMANFTLVDPKTGVAVPLRELSPSRIRRKTSRLTLATGRIAEDDEQLTPTQRRSYTLGVRRAERDSSPSPELIRSQPSLTRARTQPSSDNDSKSDSSICRSPSPPPVSASMPHVAQYKTRANNARLRRPPSIPNNLRTQATMLDRRKSMGNLTGNEFGSVGMATEQACRMLKTYRKRLTTMKEKPVSQTALDEVERELSQTLRLVRELTGSHRQPAVIQEDVELPQSSLRTVQAQAATGANVESLAILLEQTGITEMVLQEG